MPIRYNQLRKQAVAAYLQGNCYQKSEHLNI